MPKVSHRKNHKKKLRLRRELLSSSKGRSALYDQLHNLKNIYLNIFFPERMEEMRKLQEEMMEKYKQMLAEKESKNVVE